MNIKKIATIALILFVVCTIVLALWKSTKKKNTEEAFVAPSKPRLVVTNFHATKRCPSCIKIGKLTESVLRSDFAAELQSGTISWKIINTDKPEYAHFVEKYKLVSASIVLSAESEKGETAWKNLDRVWSLKSDEAAFCNYIREEVGEVLKCIASGGAQKSSGGVSDESEAGCCRR